MVHVSSCYLLTLSKVAIVCNHCMETHSVSQEELPYGQQARAVNLLANQGTCSGSTVPQCQKTVTETLFFPQSSDCLQVCLEPIVCEALL